jgi:glycine cleavage system transcriptional repressor
MKSRTRWRFFEIMKKVIIAVLGRDRPGIIATVANLLSQKNYNVENVSQTILQNEFSGIFVVSVPNRLEIEILRNHLNNDLKLMDLHLHIYEKVTEENNNKELMKESTSLTISITGPDSRGLITQITTLLAKHMVNVTDLKGSHRKSDDPNSGVMIYQVDVPSYTDIEALRQELYRKAKELSLRISIENNKSL